MATEALLYTARPEDGIIYYAPTMIRPFFYYAQHLGRIEDLPDPIYPSYGWLGYSATRYSPDYRRIATEVIRRRRVVSPARIIDPGFGHKHGPTPVTVARRAR